MDCLSSFRFHVTGLWDPLSCDRGDMLPPKDKTTIPYFTIRIKAKALKKNYAKAWVYPQPKGWGLTPKVSFC